MNEGNAGFGVAAGANPAPERNGLVGGRAGAQDIGGGGHRPDGMKEKRAACGGPLTELRSAPRATSWSRSGRAGRSPAKERSAARGAAGRDSPAPLPAARPWPLSDRFPP